MKFRTFLAITGICFFAMGCTTKVAIDYNNMIAEKQKSMGAAMDAAEPELKNYFATFEYDSIVNVSSRMEIRIDSIVQQIKNQPAPKVNQGENFKNATLGYFNNIKSIYTSYKNYGLQTTPEGRQMERQVMSTMISQENKMITDMQEAQRIFAKDNNFKIRIVNQNNSLVSK